MMLATDRLRAGTTTVEREPSGGGWGAVLTDHSGLSPVERALTVFTRIRPGEGRSTFLFFLHGFLLLFSYYIVRVLREAFILTDFSAEVRSYGYAVIALVLMFVVPMYGAVRKRIDGERLLQAVTVFFAVNMLGFSAPRTTASPRRSSSSSG
jgi:hypothetical protein